MTSDQNVAFGRPGVEPSWTGAAKEGVGTAASGASMVWFTASSGVLNEIYWPTIDHPQVRDLQLLVTDGETFFHDVRRDHVTTVEKIDEVALGLRLMGGPTDGRYTLTREVIADPDQSVLLVRVRIEADLDLRPQLRVFVLCAPHLEIGGWGNNAAVARVGGRAFLTANKNDTWLVLAADRPFRHTSVGYVGRSDGWQDLSADFEMDWQFESAPDGNVALIGEIDLSGDEFTFGLGFGDRRHRAITAVLQGLGHDFAHVRALFVEQWRVACHTRKALEPYATDGGKLYRTSTSLLLAHEDKTYRGALIASLSIPWGEARGDRDLGGYHLVWTRDMVNSATGLLAAGNMEAPLRSLIYLAATQGEDGGFPQNFWISGVPYWAGVQLDEVAFPILLAAKLERMGGLENFDPYPLVNRAAGYLIRNGPVTPQERWEEASGHSPSTLASNIAALLCAAGMSRRRGRGDTASFLEDYADWLEAHIEDWTVTSAGTLHPDVPRHFVRINPADPANPRPPGAVDDAVLTVANRAPDERREFPAKEVVDAGFLELVRYGIRRPDEPLIEDSLAVVDRDLRFDAPQGPAWRRYNHDGYGQRDDGGPFEAWGRGRPWPLLSGERAHFELAAGSDVSPYVRALEGFAYGIGLLPEQIWDGPDLPGLGLRLGGPTGAAMPLMWAHAEYVKLLRSIHDGEVFDLVPEVAERYRRGVHPPLLLDLWKPNRRISSTGPGRTVRILSPLPFTLVWSLDEWQTTSQVEATGSGVDVWFVDVVIPSGQRAPLRFTRRLAAGWEGRDHVIEMARRSNEEVK